MLAYGFSSDEDPLAQLLALNFAAADDAANSRRPGGHQHRSASITTSYRLVAEPL